MSNVENLKPSTINKEFTKTLTQGWGLGDFVLTPLSDISSWVEMAFGWQAPALNKVASTADAALGLPGVINHVGQIKNKFEVGDYPEMTKEMALTAVNGCKVTMFFDVLSLPTFQSIAHSVKTLFWSSLVVYDGISFAQCFGKLTELKKEKANSPVGQIALIDHEINLTYLKLLQSTTMVAMGAIMLVSLVFAAIAHGILFSPVLFLGLSSSWIALNFVTFFYEKMIDQWKGGLPTWSAQAPKNA